VRAEGDGTLRIDKKRYYPAGPLEFRTRDGRSVVQFVEGAGGGIRRFAGSPYSTYEKVAWTGNPDVHLALVVACLTVFATAVLFWPVVGLARPPQHRGLFRIGAAWMAWIASSVALISLAVVADAGESLVESMPPAVRVALTANYAVLGFGLLCAICAVVAWRRKVWALPMRVHYTMVVAACLVYSGWLHSWNLLGVRP
jgi:hypothetical protein